MSRTGVSCSETQISPIMRLVKYLSGVFRPVFPKDTIMPLTVGSHIDHYRITHPLGQGNNGTVFLAKHKLLPSFRRPRYHQNSSSRHSHRVGGLPAF